jgi:hypothetical protein
MLSSPAGGTPSDRRARAAVHDPDPLEGSTRIMAKRARGTSHRPGQRAPLRRSGSTRAAEPVTPAPSAAQAPRPPTLTPEEEARAAALEAQILAEEKAAEAASRRTRERTRRAADVETTTRAGSIASQAAAEYGYVVRDVRRIAVIAGSLVAVLLGLWVVVEATGIGPF